MIHKRTNIIITILFILLAQMNAKSLAQAQSELSDEELEIIMNMEFLDSLDFLEEDPDLIENYDEMGDETHE